MTFINILRIGPRRSHSSHADKVQKKRLSAGSVAYLLPSTDQSEHSKQLGPPRIPLPRIFALSIQPQTSGLRSAPCIYVHTNSDVMQLGERRYVADTPASDNRGAEGTFDYEL